MAHQTRSKKQSPKHSSERKGKRSSKKKSPGLAHEWQPRNGDTLVASDGLEADQAQEGDILAADLPTFHERRRATAASVSTQAELGMVTLKSQATQAAQDFLAYAKPLAASVDNANSHTSLLTAIASVALAPIAGVFTAPAVPVLASLLSQALSEMRAYTAKTIGALATETSLTRGLDVFPTSIGDAIAGLRRNLLEPVRHQLGELQAAAREKVLTIPSHLEQLERVFFDGTTGDIDTALPLIGLPSVIHADKYYAEMYHALVLAFEREYVWAAATGPQRMRMSFAEGGGVGYGNESLTRNAVAGRRADRALNQRLQKRSRLSSSPVSLPSM